MKELARAYPMVLLLVPVVLFLLVCNHFQWPVNLLRQTECDALDSLRTYAFVLQSTPRATKRCYRYEAQIIGSAKALIYVRRDSTRAIPQAGDTIIAQTRLRRPKPLGSFNYALYLRRQGFIGTAYVWRYSFRPAATHQPSLQRRLVERLRQSGLNGDELATVSALTLGYKEDLDPALRRRFQASGAAHVLAVSGLHTGIIYAILVGLLSLGGRLKPRYENRAGRCIISSILIAALWAYAWLTGFTPSVVRCVVMLTLFEISRMLYRSTNSLNIIAAAAVLILLVRPLDLWNIGFQLSFAATTAIVIVATDFASILHRREWHQPFYGRIFGWIVGTVIISLVAQLGTLPISLYTFGQMSNYFLLTNLIVLPLALFIVPCGFASIAFGGTVIGKAIGFVTNGLAWLMNNAVGWIESLPGSCSHAHIDGVMVGLLYTAFLMGWLTLHRSLWWLSGVLASLAAFCLLFIGWI